MTGEPGVFIVERADLFRSYANICEMPRRDPSNGQMRTPGDIMLNAARCFRIIADAIERGDPNIPPEWRG